MIKIIVDFFKKLFNKETNKIIAVDFYNKDNVLDIRYLSKREYEVYNIIKEFNEKIQAITINRALKNDIPLALVYKILEDLVFMGIIECEETGFSRDPSIKIKKYFIRNKITI